MERKAILPALLAALAWSGFLLGHSHYLADDDGDNSVDSPGAAATIEFNATTVADAIIKHQSVERPAAPHQVEPVFNPTLVAEGTPAVLIPARRGPMYETPTNPAWVRMRQPFRASRAHYVGNVVKIEKRGKLGNCGSTLDVFAWLMQKVNGRHDGFLTVAYGGLLRLASQGDLVDDDLRLPDDGVEAMASSQTFAYVASLEPELFKKFGWTMRAFVANDDRHLPFGQLVAACGHRVDYTNGTAESDMPVIDMNVVATLSHVAATYMVDNVPTSVNVVKDMWRGVLYPENMIFPVQRRQWRSRGTDKVLELQLPNRPTHMLECLYGNWKEYSPQHAGEKDNCFAFA